MTKTAKRFLDAVEISWDSPQPWEKTAALGLSEYDRHIVRGWARKAGERPTVVEREIVHACKARVAQ